MLSEKVFEIVKTVNRYFNSIFNLTNAKSIEPSKLMAEFYAHTQHVTPSLARDFMTTSANTIKNSIL